MHRYRVVERWDESELCALRCSAGRYHVARSLRAMPPLHATLNGTKPQLGFGLLVCAASGATFRVIFEAIDDARPLRGHSSTPIQPPVSTRPGHPVGLTAARS